MPKPPRKSSLKRKRPNAPVETLECLDEDASDSSDEEYDAFEEAIVSNANKRNLTTQNVKSILHHLLADKRLLQLAKSVAGDSSDWNSSTENAEPKMTRSRYKPESPTKHAPSILDLEFCDDSDDDEEYEPEREVIPSEDDSVSSFADVSSRDVEVPSTEKSSTSASPSSHSQTDDGAAVSLSPMRHTFKKPADRSSAAVKDDELISRRTRSQLSMNHISLEVIEAGCAPDFDPEIYGTEEVDDLDQEDILWKAWLNDLSKPEAAVEESFDEKDDEDFNFMADEEQIDQEELRNDRAVRVSQREVQELFDELLEGYDASEELDTTFDCEDAGDELDWRGIALRGGHAPTTVTFSDDERNQLESQLQQHCQLLTQVYILCVDNGSLADEAKTTKELVIELNTFKERTKANVGGDGRHTTAFSFQGLEHAVKIIESNQQRPQIGPLLRSCRPTPSPESTVGTTESKTKSKRRRTRDTVSSMLNTTAILLAGNPYFACFPELMPMCPMRTRGELEPSRPVFLPSEDNLLALGLSQFDQNWKLIQQNLLPLNTPLQLMYRCKNLCAKREANNPVKHFKSTSLLPLFNNTVNVKEKRALPVFPLYKIYRQLPSNMRIPDWLRIIQKHLFAVETWGMLPPQCGDCSRMRYRPIIMKGDSDAKESCNTVPVVEKSRGKKKPKQTNNNRQQHTTTTDNSTRQQPTSPTAYSNLDSVASSIVEVASPGLSTTYEFTNEADDDRCVPSPPAAAVADADDVSSTPDVASVAMKSSSDVDSPPANDSSSCMDSGGDFSAEIVASSSLQLTTIAKGNTTHHTTPLSPSDSNGKPPDSTCATGSATVVSDSVTASLTPPHQGAAKGCRRTPKQGASRHRPSFNLDHKLNEKAQRYAEMYYDNVKNVLLNDPARFEEFSTAIKLWTNRPTRKAIDLYKTLSRILEDHPNLLDEFVGFMHQEEALEIGKLDQWMHFDKATAFLVSCERQLYKTPASYKKLLRTIIQQASQGSGTQQFIEAITPHFRGNQHLAAEFCTFFPGLPPPPGKDSDFEVIPYKPDIGLSHVDAFEEIPFSQMEESNLSTFASRRRALAAKKIVKKPVRPTTKRSNKDNTRSSPSTSNERTMKRPTRAPEATQIGLQCEEEIDADGARNGVDYSDVTSPLDNANATTDMDDDDNSAPMLPVSTPTSPLRNGDAPPDDTGLASSLPADNLQFSPVSAKVIRWSRNEDRIILCTCQQKGNSPETFSEIARGIPGKSAEEVKGRFQKLMALIERQTT